MVYNNPANVPALRPLVEWQIQEGIHGPIPLGSTGEFLSMMREERQQVIEPVVDQARRIADAIGIKPFQPSADAFVTTRASPGRMNSRIVSSSVRPERDRPETFLERMTWQPTALRAGIWVLVFWSVVDTLA
jgi:hypothetical protein